MSDDRINLRIDQAPTPEASPDTLAWCREAGELAAKAGSPPMAPAEFAAYAKAWYEGWLRVSRSPGWKSLRTDYDWREHT